MQPVLNVIGQLYDAATDVHKWPVFLEGLAELFDAPFTNILHFDPQEEKFNFWLTHGANLPTEDLETLQTIFARDPRVVECMKFPEKPLSCRLSIGEEAWHQSETYQSSLALSYDFPIVEYSLTLVLPAENGGMTGLAIMRLADGEAFSQEDCDLLGGIIPHLKRAIDLQKRFVEADFAHRTALEVLDHMPTAIIVSDAAGRIKHQNNAASEIMHRSDGVSTIGGLLKLENSVKNSEMRRAIEDAIESARSGDILSGHSISVDRSSGSEAYSLMVSTLWGNHLRLGLGVLDEPLAVIFVTDPDRPQEAPAELLQRLYGLTPSEARLVEGLVKFNSLEDAAKGISISIQTARQYLKSVFQKTDTQRQPMLIKKILSSPIWMHKQSRT